MKLCATSGKNYKAMTAFDGSLYYRKNDQGWGMPCAAVF